LPNFGDEINFFADISHIENMQYYAKKKSMHQVVSLTTTGSRSKAPYRSLLEPNGMEPDLFNISDTFNVLSYQLSIDTASKYRQLI
jgi:hypothetical protein